MENVHENRPLSSVPGVSALAVWSLYLLLALASIPDVPYRMMINSFFGLLACVAVVLNYRRWRFAVVLASCVYLVVYAVQVIRMTGMMASSDMSSLLSALAFYYSASWIVATGVFVERGVAAGLAYGFLEYVMPVLIVALIVVTLISPRKKSAASYAR
jgi:hypothetical protein